jgi:hypothetical protein
MDFKKIITTALIPTVVLVVLGVISALLSIALATALGGLLGIVVTIGIFAVSCLVLLYAGYSATKQKLDLISAVLVGATAGFVSSIINGIINLIAMFFNPASTAALSTAGAGGPAVMIAGGLIALVVGIIFWLVAGLVLGAIGGFVGQRM